MLLRCPLLAVSSAVARFTSALRWRTARWRVDCYRCRHTFLHHSSVAAKSTAWHALGEPCLLPPDPPYLSAQDCISHILMVGLCAPPPAISHGGCGRKAERERGVMAASPATAFSPRAKVCPLTSFLNLTVCLVGRSSHSAPRRICSLLRRCPACCWRPWRTLEGGVACGHRCSLLDQAPHCYSCRVVEVHTALLC